ncbi:MAG: beta-ketoacyl-[acyl-carrier-protein] synthase family protein [Chitinispirillia bacterium]|jgi:3-oxoacyl-[acyl-carrier-protein] synthase II
MKNIRVVITGMGCITPIGCGIDSFWKAAVAGTNGVRPLTSIDTADYKTKVGGEVLDFDSDNYISPEKKSLLGRSSQYAIAATQMAVRDAQLNISQLNPFKIGISYGTTMGEPQILDEGIKLKYKSNSTESIPAGLSRQYPCCVIPANIAREFNIKGPVIMIPTACAAGNYAIGYGFDQIKLGKIDVAISGGSDPFSSIAFTGFNRLIATTPDVCRPFDAERKGMAVSEGSGSLIIENLEHAIKRNAPIYAEILGYGLACDAFKMTIPDPEGGGGIIAMERAIKQAQIEKEEVDYICAHGTGTGENDKSETLIAKRVFGKKAYDIPMSSIKSMLGHTMGAASAIEAIACILMLKNNTILPTINYENPDPLCDLDYVPNIARKTEIKTAVSNAYAFAGNTSSIILRKYEG